MTKPVKLGLVLISNAGKPLPSTRIAILNMLPYLEAAGYEPHVVFQPSASAEEPDVTGLARSMQAQGIDVAIFQKVHGPSVLAEARDASARGIKTVYAVCDFIDNEMAEATHGTIVVSDYLKTLYDPRHHHKIYVVHDGIEKPEVVKQDYDAHRDSARVRAVLVTASALSEIPVLVDPPDFVDVTVIGRYTPDRSVMARAKSAYWSLRAADSYPEMFRIAGQFARKRFETVSWSFETVHRLMTRADVGIIPIDMRHDPLPGQRVSSWQVRSENRLTMKMAVGLPVVASPVPSYLPVIEQGKNGYIAETPAQWVDYLKELRNPSLRQEIGRKARSSVLTRYSKEEQARKLIRALETVRAAA